MCDELTIVLVWSAIDVAYLVKKTRRKHQLILGKLNGRY